MPDKHKRGKKHGANGTRISPGSSVDYQGKPFRGEMLPTPHLKVEPRMQTADPKSPDWKRVAPGNPLRYQFVRHA